MGQQPWSKLTKWIAVREADRAASGMGVTHNNQAGYPKRQQYTLIVRDPKPLVPVSCGDQLSDEF